jgi:16S rRNA (uracil1498-N3)-methyltransferase
MQPGDEILVLDNSGQEWQVKLTTVAKNKVEGEIVAQGLAGGEPPLAITLYQGTLKGQKFEWVLQKGTEIGVSTFVPTICQRSIPTSPETLQKKYERWQRIIQEAAEQSRRGKLPELGPPVLLSTALAQLPPDTLTVLPWEEAGAGSSLKALLKGQQLQNVALFIGPEGGFTSTEAALAQAADVHLVTLGPRILRAETAGLVACAALLYEREWG